MDCVILLTQIYSQLEAGTVVTIRKLMLLHVLSQDIMRLEQRLPYRSKRSLFAPPMTVTENQRGPFPRVLGRVRNTQMWEG